MKTYLIGVSRTWEQFTQFHSCIVSTSSAIETPEHFSEILAMLRSRVPRLMAKDKLTPLTCSLLQDTGDGHQAGAAAAAESRAWEIIRFELLP